jgi:PLD-like domain
MIRLTSNLWASIESHAKNARRKVAAVAYVSNDSRVKFRRGDTLIVDASDQQIKSGATSARVLRDAVARGARVYSLPKLHAKLMVFDNIVIIGSANISESSATALKEIGIISDSPQLTKDGLSIIDNLKRNWKSCRVDKPFIKRISEIEVTPKGRNGGGQKKKPTILEAFQSNTSSLDDFRFYLVEEKARLTKDRIMKEARKNRIELPNRWTWYEFHPYSKYIDTLIQRLFDKLDHRMLVLDVRSVHGHVQPFELTPHSFLYLWHTQVDDTIAFVCRVDKRPPFKIDRKSAQQFCSELNHSLKANPRFQSKFDAKRWFLEAEEIAEILQEDIAQKMSSARTPNTRLAPMSRTARNKRISHLASRITRNSWQP